MEVISFIENFGYTSLVEDLRADFLGHAVMHFEWNKLYDRELQTSLSTVCVNNVYYSHSYRPYKIFQLLCHFYTSTWL